MQKIRILIVDDQTIVRSCLRILIDAQPDMEVVGKAQDSGSALDKTRATKPDVVIMAIGMPDASGMGTIEQLLKVCPLTRILVLTRYDDPTYARSVLAAGGSAYILMRATTSDLLAAIRAVHSGQCVVEPTLVGLCCKISGGNARPAPRQAQARHAVF